MAISDQRIVFYGNRFLAILAVIYEGLEYSGSKVIDLRLLREHQVFRHISLDSLDISKTGRAADGSDDEDCTN